MIVKAFTRVTRFTCLPAIEQCSSYICKIQKKNDFINTSGAQKISPLVSDFSNCFFIHNVRQIQHFRRTKELYCTICLINDVLLDDLVPTYFATKFTTNIKECQKSVVFSPDILNKQSLSPLWHVSLQLKTTTANNRIRNGVTPKSRHRYFILDSRSHCCNEIRHVTVSTCGGHSDQYYTCHI